MKKVEIQALKMLNAALNADRVISKYDLDQLKGVSHRFIGNSYRVNRMFDLAEIEFQEAIKVFKEQKHKIPRHLEVQGFLAAVYVYQGKTAKGINLAKQTFEQLLKDKDAVELKKSDFTTWVIWITGIFPRLFEALTSTNSKYDKDLIIKYLEKSDELLKNPDNYPVWGGDMFKYRFAELRKAGKILSKLAVVFAGFVNIYQTY